FADGCPGDRVSNSRVGRVAANPLRVNAFVSGNRQSDWQAKRSASRRERLCHQSSGAGDSLPSSDSRRQDPKRISLGIGAKEEAVDKRSGTSECKRNSRVAAKYL